MEQFTLPYIAVGIGAVSLLLVLSIWFHIGRISRNSSKTVELLEKIAKTSGVLTRQG